MYFIDDNTHHTNSVKASSAAVESMVREEEGRHFAVSQRNSIDDVMEKEVSRRHEHNKRQTMPQSNRYQKNNQSSVWRIGDPVVVMMTVDAQQIHRGFVQQIHHGWYTIEVSSSSSSIHNNNKLIKCRASQLRRPASFNGTMNDNRTGTDEAGLLPHQRKPLSNEEKPTTTPTISIIDLDELLVTQCHDNNGTSTTTDVNTTTTPYAKWDIEQLQHFQSVSQWIVFSDLHCSVPTIDTCVDVLRHVHTMAQQHNAGILFLGDFWHVRSHTIRIDLLHRILSLFQQYFTQPMILIPGNHDQLSSSSSTSSEQLHSLTPFQNAYRIPIGNDRDNCNGNATTVTSSLSSINGVLIFDRPTKFLNALFIPHIRNPIDMEHVLFKMYGNSHSDNTKTADNDSTAAKIIFCHVDVTGASMNDNIVSQGGISIHAFPPNIPIYSGHFHKPHNVTTSYQKHKKSPANQWNDYDESRNNNTIGKERTTTWSINEDIRRVEYVGSPYQVSLSESQQRKGILLLNSTNDWECLERIPIQFGRQHYRPQNLNDFMSLQVATTTSSSVEDATNIATLKYGDRVVFSIHKHEMDQIRVNSTRSDSVANALDEHIASLRNSGIIVEVRETSDLQKEPRSISLDGGDGTDLITTLDRVDMSPSNVWSKFISQQVQSGVLSPVNEEILLTKGLQILDEIGNFGIDTITTATSRSMNGSTSGNFQTHFVSLRGFGPFSEEVTYPLFNRGLVLLRGSNKDGGSDSNGSGKTSLAMSILWAFTGSVDPRPLQDSKVVDVINDASKSATVTVGGEINGIKFSITRTKTSNKGSLSFFFDNTDLTRQSIKDTQDTINEKLGISPQILARTMFNGQHALNELLEASDTKLKDGLSLVVPLSIWQEALLQSRKNLRDASKRISELDGMILVRSADTAKLMMKFKEAESIHRTECSNYEECRSLLQGEIDALSQSSRYETNDEETYTIDLNSMEDDVLRATGTIRDIEQELESCYKQREVELREWNEAAARKKSQLMILDKEVQSLMVECNRVVLAETLSKERIANMQEMWKLDLSAGIPDPFVLPQRCPTCQQSISSTARTEGDGHSSLESVVLRDAEESLARLSDGQSRRFHIQNELYIANSTKLNLEANITIIQASVEEIHRKWDDAIEHVKDRLEDARKIHLLASTKFTETAKQLNALSKIASLNATIAASKDVLNHASRKVDLTRTEWNDCERLVEELNKERSNYTDVTRVLNDLCDAFGTRGIQTFIIQGAVSMLAMSTQAYLDELSDGAQRLDITLDSGDCIARKAYVRGENGFYKERSLASLSGGQWRRCSLAFTLAFTDLVANRANLRPSLMVLDEPLMHLDQSGRSNVGRLLRKLLRRDSEQNDATAISAGRSVSTILIILQDLAAEELEESFDAIDVVVKDNGVSTVYIDE